MSLKCANATEVSRLCSVYALRCDSPFHSFPCASMGTCRYQQLVQHPSARISLCLQVSCAPTFYNRPINAQHRFPRYIPQVTATLTSPSSTICPFYDRVSSRVDMHRCGRGPGKGRRSSACPYEVVVDGVQPDRMDRGCVFETRFSTIFPLLRF